MRSLLICFLVLLICLPLPSCAEEASGGVSMVCLNAGKADCILLTVEGRFYLVDAGYRKYADQMITMLTRENVDRLSGVFLTHNHKDHYGGLSALVDSGIPVDAFYTPAYCVDSLDGKHPLVQAAARRGQTVRKLTAGDTVGISDDALFQVLGPTRLNTENENNNSLVLRLESPDGSILLTGDMKFEEEYLLLSESLLTRTDVLKVAFHGDNTSTSASFLNAVRPRAAVICTSSQEEKDTPSKDTLYRLASVGCKTYVTQDAVSAVRVTLDRGKITVTLEDWTK